MGSETAWLLLLLLMVLFVSCGRDIEKTKVLQPRVPEVELEVTSFKVQGDLVVWLNEEPVGRVTAALVAPS